MKTTVRYLMYGLMISSMVFWSCTKDGTEGTPGQQGPQGAQGEQGPPGEDGADGAAANQGEQGPKGDSGQNGQDGADGQDGTDGEDGNANVISSDWIRVLSADWEGVGTMVMTFEIAVPDLSQEIADTGVILVYNDWNNRIQLLTYQYPGQLTLSYFIEAQSITLQSFFSNGSNTVGLVSMDFRYILIPSNTAAGKSEVDYSKMSYEEVINHFGLE